MSAVKLNVYCPRLQLLSPITAAVILAVGRRRVRSKPDGNLKKFAEETGGGYFELKATDELGPTFTRVAQELHSQYVLGFQPTVRDGKTHELEVRVKQRGMNARTRTSYIAANEPPSGNQPE